MRSVFYFNTLLLIGAMLVPGDTYADTDLFVDLKSNYHAFPAPGIEKIDEALCKELPGGCKYLKWRWSVTYNLLYPKEQLKPEIWKEHETPPMKCFELKEENAHLPGGGEMQTAYECAFLGLREALKYDLSNVVNAKCSGGRSIETIAELWKTAKEKCKKPGPDGFFRCLAALGPRDANDALALSLNRLAQTATELAILKSACDAFHLSKGPMQYLSKEAPLQSNFCHGVDYQRLTEFAADWDEIESHPGVLTEWQPGFEPKYVPDYFYTLNSCDIPKKKEPIAERPESRRPRVVKACEDQGASRPSPDAENLADVCQSAARQELSGKSQISKPKNGAAYFQMEKENILAFLSKSLNAWLLAEELKPVQKAYLNGILSGKKGLEETAAFYEKFAARHWSKLGIDLKWERLEKDYDDAIKRDLDNVLRKSLEKEQQSKAGQLELSESEKKKVEEDPQLPKPLAFDKELILAMPMKPRTQAELVALAQEALKNHDQPDKTDYIPYWLESELHRQEPEAEVEQKLGRLTQLWGKTEEKLKGKTKLWPFIQQLNADVYQSYIEANPRLSDFFEKNGGNCVAQTKLIIAALKRFGIGTPEPHQQILVQTFKDHVQPVLYDSKKDEVISLTSGEHIKGVEGPLYDPRVLLYSDLRRQGISPTIDIQKLLVREADPISPEQLKLMRELEQSMGYGMSDRGGADSLPLPDGANSRRYMFSANPAKGIVHFQLQSEAQKPPVRADTKQAIALAFAKTQAEQRKRMAEAEAKGKGAGGSQKNGSSKKGASGRKGTNPSQQEGEGGGEWYGIGFGTRYNRANGQGNTIGSEYGQVPTPFVFNLEEFEKSEKSGNFGEVSSRTKVLLKCVGSQDFDRGSGDAKKRQIVFDSAEDIAAFRELIEKNPDDAQARNVYRQNLYQNRVVECLKLPEAAELLKFLENPGLAKSYSFEKMSVLAGLAQVFFSVEGLGEITTSVLHGKDGRTRTVITSSRTELRPLYRAAAAFLKKTGDKPEAFLSLYTSMGDKEYAFMCIVKSMRAQLDKTDYFFQDGKTIDASADIYSLLMNPANKNAVRGISEGWERKFEAITLNPSVLRIIGDKKQELKAEKKTTMALTAQASRRSGSDDSVKESDSVRTIPMQIALDAGGGEEEEKPKPKKLTPPASYELYPYSFLSLVDLLKPLYNASASEKRGVFNAAEYDPKSIYSRLTPTLVKNAFLPNFYSFEAWRVSESRPPATRKYPGVFGEKLPYDVAVKMFDSINSGYKKEEREKYTISSLPVYNEESTDRVSLPYKNLEEYYQALKKALGK